MYLNWSQNYFWICSASCEQIYLDYVSQIKIKFALNEEECKFYTGIFYNVFFVNIWFNFYEKICLRLFTEVKQVHLISSYEKFSYTPPLKCT